MPMIELQLEKQQWQQQGVPGAMATRSTRGAHLLARSRPRRALRSQCCREDAWRWIFFATW